MQSITTHAYPAQGDVKRPNGDFGDVIPSPSGAARRAIGVQFLDLQIGLQRHLIRHLQLEASINARFVQAIRIDASVADERTRADVFIHAAESAIDGVIQLSKHGRKGLADQIIDGGKRSIHG